MITEGYVRTVATLDTVEQLPTIELVAPLPGFPEHRRFVLVRATDDGLLYALRCQDDPGLRFFVVPPAPFFPGYAPEIGEQVLEQLATVDPSDLLILLIVTVGERAADATVNLLAPLVVDSNSRRAVQVVLSENLPIRARLMAG